MVETWLKHGCQQSQRSILKVLLIFQKQQKEQKGKALFRWHIYFGKTESEEGLLKLLMKNVKGFYG